MEYCNRRVIGYWEEKMERIMGKDYRISEEIVQMRISSFGFEKDGIFLPAYCKRKVRKAYSKGCQGSRFF